MPFPYIKAVDESCDGAVTQHIEIKYVNRGDFFFFFNLNCNDNLLSVVIIELCMCTKMCTSFTYMLYFCCVSFVQLAVTVREACFYMISGPGS